MPCSNDHLIQYGKNKTLLNQPLFDLDNGHNYDWIITIAFYSALHLIEKTLFEQSQYDSPSHIVRNGLVFREKKLRHIAAQYKTLYDQSLRARYDCASFSKEDVRNVMSLLEHIEKRLVC